VQYLSDEWIEAADTALSEGWDAAADDGDGTTIAYTVSGTPQGKVTYHLHFGPEGAGIASGLPDADPDVTMELDYDTAREIERGEASAQVAFMQGRIKLGGDVTVLLRGAERLAAVGDVLASLRDRTVD
jgi:hypothetical protein